MRLASAGLLALTLSSCATPTPQPTVTAPPPSATAPPPASPTPEPPPTVDTSSIFPPVTDADWIMGRRDAGVTVLVYCDYQAEPCAPLAMTLLQLQKDRPNAVRVAYRNVPLPIYDKATLAMAAAEAAGAQDKYWEMFAALYQGQAEWSADDVAAFTSRLSGYAKSIGLNVERFDSELADNTYAPQVRAGRDSANAIQLPDGSTAGLPGVPFLVIDGDIWQGPQDLETLKSLVDLVALQARQFDAPAEVIDPLRHYTATLQTVRGDIVVELYADETPVAVNSFVFLAEQDWFDGITFHRVLPGFVAQSGDPTGTGYGGPGYTLPDEINPARTFDSAGILAMASSGPNTAGSQFFITLAPAPGLNGRYTIFGRVVEGLDVVQALAPRDPEQDPHAAPGDMILDVLIKETQ